MSDNIYIVKGSLQAVGRVRRNDSNEIIDQELDAGYTLGDVTEYSGKRYEDDMMTPAYKWNGVTHVPKDTADYLQEAKDKKLAELGNEAVNQAKKVYAFINDISVFVFINDFWLSFLPSSKDVLQGYLPTLKQIWLKYLSAVSIINDYTVIVDVENYNVVTAPNWP